MAAIATATTSGQRAFEPKAINAPTAMPAAGATMASPT
jgi:hypothetical protein